MEVTWRELVLTCGGMLVSAVGLTRLTLVGRFRLLEQMLVVFRETASHREKAYDRLSESVAALRENVAENTALLRRMVDRL